MLQRKPNLGLCSAGGGFPSLIRIVYHTAKGFPIIIVALCFRWLFCVVIWHGKVWYIVLGCVVLCCVVLCCVVLCGVVLRCIVLWCQHCRMPPALSLALLPIPTLDVESTPHFTFWLFVKPVSAGRGPDSMGSGCK